MPQSRILFLFIVALGLLASPPNLNAQVDDEEPLRPPDISSPRETFESFLSNARALVARYQEAGRDAAFMRIRDRIFRTMDLSEIPPVNRIDRGGESAAYLIELMNRIELPALADVPDADEVEATGIERWRLPGTDIYINQVAEGDLAGSWQFSAETLRQLPKYYSYVENIPVNPDAIPFSIEAALYGSGSLLPDAWVENLPGWAYHVVGGQTVWQWIGTVLVLGGGLVVIVVAYIVGRRFDFRQRSRTLRAGHYGRLGATLLAIALYRPAVAFLEDGINLSRGALFSMQLALTAVFFIAVAWAVILAFNAIGELVIRWRGSAEGATDVQITRIIVRFLGAVVVIYFGLLLSEEYGVPAAPLIASLGVSSLAVALAVRPTLENLINGMILFADKPVRVGEFCQFGDEVGTVERIGLRSTRIRLLDRRLLTIPNAEFATMQISNFALRDQMLFKTIIGLRYETTPDQLRFVLTKIRELFIAHPKVSPDPARARFVGFGDHSLDVELFAYVTTNDWSEYLGIAEDLNLRVMDVIEDSGTGFAFPSQTTYLARDTGMNADRTQAAEAEVDLWRQGTQLPFPEVAPERVRELRDSLDFPPKGSQEYREREVKGPPTAEQARRSKRWRMFGRQQPGAT